MTARPATTQPAVVGRRRPRWSNHQEPVQPVADRRLTGDHWWDPDRLAHEADVPRFCPNCGASTDAAGTLAVEYWEADRRIYHLRCDRCDWSGDIARVDRMVGMEPPH